MLPFQVVSRKKTISVAYFRISGAPKVLLTILFFFFLSEAGKVIMRYGIEILKIRLI